MSATDRNLERWLRQQIFRSREQPLVSFQLRHAGIGGRGAHVEDFQVPGTVSPDVIETMRDQILQSSQAYADGLGDRIQRFILIALEQGEKDGPRHAFRVTGEGAGDSEGGEEPPTEKGLTAQLMRHNEALMRMFVQGQGAMVNGLATRLDRQDQHIERLMDQRFKDQELLEQSKSEQHMRDMQLMLTSGEEDRKAIVQKSLLGKVETLFPLIFNKLSGKQALSSDDHSVVAGLVESLSEEQIRTMAQVMRPEQQMLLLTIFREVRARRAKEEDTTNGSNGTPAS